MQGRHAIGLCGFDVGVMLDQSLQRAEVILLGGIGKGSVGGECGDRQSED
jgi:hypothetical protein